MRAAQIRRMTLDKWMSDTGTTATALARQLGCSISTITRARTGALQLSPALAAQIEVASGGAVAAETLSADLRRAAELRAGTAHASKDAA